MALTMSLRMKNSKTVQDWTQLNHLIITTRKPFQNLVPLVEASSVSAEVVIVATGRTMGASSMDSPGTKNIPGLKSHSHQVISREELLDRKRFLPQLNWFLVNQL